MDLLRTYWRWLALIAVVAVLTNSRNLPWPFVTLVLGADGRVTCSAKDGVSGGAPADLQPAAK
jgi:hypothetical protein